MYLVCHLQDFVNSTGKFNSTVVNVCDGARIMYKLMGVMVYF